MSQNGSSGPRGRAAAAFLLLAVAACARAGETVARAGAIEVGAEELRAYVETLAPEERQALASNPALLSQAIRTYLARKAVLAEAVGKKWDQQPAVRAQLDRVRDQALTELYLSEVSRPPDGWPTEAEVKAAYDGNQAAFAVPTQFRVAQIFVAAGADAGSEEKGRKRIEAVSKKLREKGADFAAIAGAESDDRESAPRGGEIGWLAEAQMVPGIRKPVAALAKDSVSAPVRLESGWHVLKLLDLRAASVRPFPEVKDAIAARLRVERAKANRQAYLARLLEQQPPVVNELALSKLMPAAR